MNGTEELSNSATIGLRAFLVVGLAVVLWKNKEKIKDLYKKI